MRTPTAWQRRWHNGECGACALRSNTINIGINIINTCVSANYIAYLEDIKHLDARTGRQSPYPGPLSLRDEKSYDDRRRSAL